MRMFRVIIVGSLICGWCVAAHSAKRRRRRPRRLRTASSPSIKAMRRSSMPRAKSNGNILATPMGTIARCSTMATCCCASEAAKIAEISPDKKIVWQYESKPKAGYTGHVEVHSFQRLPDGLTMIAEGGNRRIVEVDKDGKIVHEIPLVVEHPNPHVDTRMARKLDNGHYLVCQGGDSTVREYDGAGKVVWSYKLDLDGRPASGGHGPEGHGTEPYGAIRLPNGNTLIAAGNGNRVIEVSPEGKVVWKIEQHELPGITLAWVTTLEVLPNGNLIFGNCHAGPENPQLIEVTRDKRVVWTFKNFKTFGNAVAAAQVLDVQGKVIR